ncbi:hypothetical protein BJV77DRAFT_563395 [Russula vinacea]|nr:hypothetical protein BJV77DRAFT_563395 [Russula vinacea]
MPILPFKSSLLGLLGNASSPTMQTSPDVESQVPVNQDRVDEKDPNLDAPTNGIAPKYGDTSSAYWKLYRSEAEINDKNLVETLMGNTNSMVFLNSLFSSIVASFIIEIYKILQTPIPQVPPFASISCCFSASSSVS